MLYVNREAVYLYKDYPDAFARLRARAMACDFSWARSAGENLHIYSAVTGKNFDEIQQEFAGCGYGDFKLAVGEAVAEELRPIREEYERLMADKGYLESCYREGAEKARAISQRTLDKVYKKIGFLPAAK